MPTTLLLALLVALLPPGEVQGGLALTGARCGQLVCDLHQFCAPDDQRCAPCSSICSQHHNTDTDLCIQHCQDYLHDMRYFRKDDETQTLRETVQKLQFQVSVIIIICSLVLVLLLALLGVTCFRHGRIYIVNAWCWLKKHISKKKSSSDKYPTDLTHENPHTESPKPWKKVDGRPRLNDQESNSTNQRRDLSLEMNTNQPLNIQSLQQNNRSSGQIQTPETASTMVTMNSRLPAEDSTLDYSYDNVGMNLTPSPNTTPRAEALAPPARPVNRY